MLDRETMIINGISLAFAAVFLLLAWEIFGIGRVLFTLL